MVLDRPLVGKVTMPTDPNEYIEKTFLTPDESFINAAPEIEFIFKIEADEPGLRVKVIPLPGRGSNNEMALFFGSCRIRKLIFLNESNIDRRLS